MIKVVKREDYSSEEEYQEAYQRMLEAIKKHNEQHPEPEYNPNYKEEFLKSVSGLRLKPSLRRLRNLLEEQLNCF